MQWLKGTFEKDKASGMPVVPKGSYVPSAPAGPYGAANLYDAPSSGASSAPAAPYCNPPTGQYGGGAYNPPRSSGPCAPPAPASGPCSAPPAPSSRMYSAPPPAPSGPYSPPPSTTATIKLTNSYGPQEGLPRRSRRVLMRTQVNRTDMALLSSTSTL